MRRVEIAGRERLCRECGRNESATLKGCIAMHESLLILCFFVLSGADTVLGIEHGALK